jgi:putative membrane protein
MGAVPLLAIAAALAGAAPALAHAPPAATPTDPLWRWNLEPWLLWLLLLAACLYAAGLLRLWRQAGVNRGLGRWQAAAFAGGWLGVVAALVSPLDSFGAHLFSAHMVQHELLMIVAAPLLVLGRPLAAWTWALSPRYRRTASRIIRTGWLAWSWDTFTQPLAAWSCRCRGAWPICSADWRCWGGYWHERASPSSRALTRLERRAQLLDSGA